MQHGQAVEMGVDVVRNITRRKTLAASSSAGSMELRSRLSHLSLNDGFTFLDNYLLAPAHRGYGVVTWHAALHHVGERTIGLEAPAEVAAYQDVGFDAFYATIHCRGRIPCVVLAVLDEASQLGPRPKFLAEWLSDSEHDTLVLLRGGEVAGFGTIRRAHTGLRLGPLIAENETDALALYGALAASHLGEHIDMQALQPNLGALYVARGLSPARHPVRTYTSLYRPVDLSPCFAPAALAYG